MPQKEASIDDWKRWNLLKNRVVMKAVLKGNTGEKKLDKTLQM
jgi:hypothetical protein